MVGFFTDPYFDEMFYSICARYGEHRMCVNKADATADLLSRSGSTVSALGIYGFPTHLKTLIENLPEGHLYTTDYFIENHSLFPLFRVFMLPEKVEVISQYMLDTGSIPYFFGSPFWIAFPKFLQFCPCCVTEDRETLGECYWHRTHNAPGVKVCTKHKVWLQHSKIQIQGKVNPYAIAAEEAVDLQEPCFLNLDNTVDKQHFHLATAVEWLLQTPNLDCNLTIVRRKYTNLLINMELASYTGKPKYDRILDLFNKSFHPDFLSSLGCAFNETLEKNWMHLILSNHTSTQSPIHHLLLIHMLAQTPEMFFTESHKLNFFGDGPWPCLNPICDDYKKNCIQEHELTFRIASTPQGIFRCPKCDFTYVRIGISDNPYKYSKVISYGELWERKLEELCYDTNLNPEQICAMLNIGPKTLEILLATKFGIDDRRSMVLAKRRENLIADHRQTILSAMQANPAIRRIDLQRQYPAAFPFLLKHDNDWLEANAPVRQNAKPVKRKTNEEKIADYRQTILSAIQANPNIKRYDLIKQHNTVYTYLSRNDIQWFEANMPPIRAQITLEQERAQRIATHRHTIESAIKQTQGITRKQLQKRYGAAYGYLNKYDKEWLISHLPAPVKDGRKGVVPDKILQYRDTLLSAIELTPDITRGEIYARFDAQIKYLRKHDLAWVEANMPKKISSAPIGVDWHLRDLEYVKILTELVIALRNEPGRPVRISRERLLALTGLKRTHADNGQNIPLTSAVLSTFAETREDIAYRRLEWATVLYYLQFQETGRIPTRSQLITTASIRWLLHLPGILKALDNALNLFY